MASPPGPRSLNPGGSRPAFWRDPLGFLTRSARRYGDISSFRFFHIRVWLLAHPDDIEWLLSTRASSFEKGRSLQAGRVIFGNGLLTSEGDFWRRQRRLAQPAFHRDRIASYGTTMSGCTEKMLEGWRPGETRDIHQDLMRLTLAIVGKTLFGADVEGEAADVGRALEVSLTEFPRLLNPLRRLGAAILPTRRNRALKQAVRDLDRIVFDLIRRKRESGRDTGDLLSMFLAARDEDGSGMTDQQLRDESLTLFLAGHETTAIALTWTFYLLSQNPAVRRKLEEELDAVLAERAPAAADLPRMPFTESVVKESLRLYPPAWAMGRTAVEDVDLKGYRLAKGGSVLVSPWVTHRDPRFFEEPDAFRPERWADPRMKDLPKFAYFPFGGGPRICIGNQFAMMEAILATATVARRFRLSLAPGHPVETFPSITLRPRHGMRMTVEERRPAIDVGPRVSI
jgi:cytochrome P450